MSKRSRWIVGVLGILAAAAVAFFTLQGARDRAEPLATTHSEAGVARDLVAQPSVHGPVPVSVATTPASANALRGDVIGVDGSPAIGASVTAFRLKDDLSSDSKKSPPRWAATTDDRGRFAFEGVPEGTYGLSARTATASASIPYVRVAARGDATVALHLVAAVAIEGRVTDEMGGPIRGARVMVDANAPLRLLYRDVYRELLCAKQEVLATTDDQGVFRIAPLEAGGYQLAVSAPGGVRPSLA